MFARKYWFAISDQEYEQLKPTLQLTTMLLNTPACLGLYATLLFGERAMYPSFRNGIRTSQPRIKEEVHLTSFKAGRVKEMFCDLEGVFKFTSQTISPAAYAETHYDQWCELTDIQRTDIEWQLAFHQISPVSARMSLKHGKTVDKIEGEEKEFCFKGLRGFKWTTFEIYPWKNLQDPRTRMTRCTIVLSTLLLLRLRKRLHSPEDALRFNLFVAAVILHELAHAVEAGRPELREFGVLEAMLPGNDEPELGHEMIMRVFNGIPLGQGKTGEWPQFYLPEDDTGQVYIIPLAFIARIQQQEFWDSLPAADLSNFTLLHFPRTMPCFRPYV